MSGVERYLKRATRGLWGQKKRDAVTELRGAIEDKVYRHRLCGLSDVEAERAALRDLGNPAAVARDLNRVHTGPQVTRMTLLLGVTGLLGFQAVAQVNVVRAIPDPRAVTSCAFDDAYLKTLTPQNAAVIRQRLSTPGERARMVSECREHQTVMGNQLLRVADIWAAFRSSGVTVQQLPGSAGLYNMTFPGSDVPRLIDLGQSVQFVGGEKYVDIMSFTFMLADRTDVPLQMNGTVNPTLKVGAATLHLGTPAAPVRASDVYASSLLSPTELRLDQQLAVMLSNATERNSMYSFRAAVPDGTHYAVLDNHSFVCHCDEGTARYLMSVQVAEGGRVSTGASGYSTAGGVPVMVSTLEELKAATVADRRALLVYRLNNADLRRVIGNPMPAAPLSPPASTGGQ